MVMQIYLPLMDQLDHILHKHIGLETEMGKSQTLPVKTLNQFWFNVGQASQINGPSKHNMGAVMTVMQATRL